MRGIYARHKEEHPPRLWRDAVERERTEQYGAMAAAIVLHAYARTFLLLALLGRLLDAFYRSGIMKSFVHAESDVAILPGEGTRVNASAACAPCWEFL